MKSIYTILVTLSVLSFSSVTVFAAQPPVPVIQSGQVKCYLVNGTETTCNGTGQDGELKPGVAWPTTRFADNTDGTITDNMTGLIWSKNMGTPGPETSLCSKTGTYVTWQEALDQVKCMNQYRYLNFNDWRLPTAEELASIVNYSAGDQDAWLTASGFTKPGFSGSNETYYYWTSTTQTDSKTSAFVFDKGNGNVSPINKTYSYYGSGWNENYFGRTGGTAIYNFPCGDCGFTQYNYASTCSVRTCSFFSVWPVRGNL